MVPWLLALALAGAPETEPKPPEWSKSELRGFFDRAGSAGQQAKSDQEYNELLVQIPGAAYKLRRDPNEPVEAYAKRIVRSRRPRFPELAPGFWLYAALHVFYADAAKRADVLSRFELDRHERLYLAQKAQEAKVAGEQAGAALMMRIEGIDQPMPPLPVAEAGDKLDDVGLQVLVRGTDVTIGPLKRASFPGDLPPENTKRTGGGAIKEFVSAMKQHAIHAEMMSRVDRKLLLGKAALRYFAGATSRARYLNEVVRAANEAGMERVDVAVSLPSGLGKVTLPLKPGKAKTPPTRVRCKDDVTLEACLGWVAEQRAKGPITFGVAD